MAKELKIPQEINYCKQHDNIKSPGKFKNLNPVNNCRSMSFLDYFKTHAGLQELDPDTVEKKALEEGTVMVDVRTRSEYGRGHISNSKNIPLGSLNDHLSNLPRDQKYILICATGHRSRAAGALFLKNGFVNVSHMKGGMGAWLRSGKSVEK